jgi:hypothetical protein
MTRDSLATVKGYVDQLRRYLKCECGADDCPPAGCDAVTVPRICHRVRRRCHPRRVHTERYGAPLLPARSFRAARPVPGTSRLQPGCCSTRLETPKVRSSRRRLARVATCDRCRSYSEWQFLHPGCGSDALSCHAWRLLGQRLGPRLSCRTFRRHEWHRRACWSTLRHCLGPYVSVHLDSDDSLAPSVVAVSARLTSDDLLLSVVVATVPTTRST